LWQAQFVQWLLQEQWPEDHFNIISIQTQGDNLDLSISEEGGKGLYVKEIEEALRDGRIDVAVHSMKDFPVKPAEGCVLAACAERGEVRDVLVSQHKIPLHKFTAKMKIGTSSLRRRALLLSQNCQAEIVNIRGNVDSRVRKAKEGEVDGVIVAAAGLLRLGLENEITEYFDSKLFIPAPGQGAIAVECREIDEDLRLKLRRIHHDESAQGVSAERAFLGALGGNCTLPLGAWCEIEQFQMRLHAFLSDEKAEQVMMDRAIAPIGYGEKLGLDLAERFLTYGAKGILTKLGKSR